MAIDYDRNPHRRPLVKVINADLSTPQGQKLVTKLHADFKPKVCHSAPPCGTASKARDKAIPAWLKAKGAPEPPPLRSSQHPRGLPGLTGLNLLRVEKANCIYDFVIELSIQRHLNEDSWSMENPSTSYYWELERMLYLMSLPGVYCADFQQCCHGGERPVWRRWVGNMKGLIELIAKCPGENRTHKHKSFCIRQSSQGWAFDTALEAAYPDELCVKYAAIVLQTHKPHIADHPQVPVPNNIKLRASVGMYIRGNRYPPMVSEFAETAIVPAISHMEPGSIVELQPGIFSKVLKCTPQSGPESAAPFSTKIGTYRTPQEFIQAATSLRHPIDDPSLLPEALIRNVFTALTTPPNKLAKDRLQKIQLMRTWAIELAAQNTKLIQSLDVPKARILCEKHLLLMKKVLEHISYPDTSITEDIARGTIITGDIATSSVFTPRRIPATTTSEALLDTSTSVRSSVVARISSSGDSEIDDAVWEETLQESNKHWLSEEMDLAEIEAIVGPLFVIARRFGIKQSGKVRAIDDYTISGANAAATTTEKLDLLGNDEMFALLKLILTAINDQGEVRIELPTGEILNGRLPPGTTPQEGRDWLGKTFDLKAAYRQIPTARDGNNPAFTVIGVYCPITRRPAFFLQYATPFGAISSVYIFNRAARAIHAIGLWVGFCWGNYFDDYPILEMSKATTTTDIAIRSMCALLGWTLSLEEKKNKPFAAIYNQLGLVVNMSQLKDGRAIYENKPERVADISEMVNDVIKRKRCPKPLMAEIRGKGQYAASQVAGRVANGVLHELGDHQYKARTDELSQHNLDLLARLRDIISNSRPRSISCFGETRPILVFTDAAAEGKDRRQVSIGALTIDTAVRPLRANMWGRPVDDRLIDVWQKGGNVQVIGQAELLPVVMVRAHHLEDFRHRRVIFFVDNDSARQTLIRGYSQATASKSMLRLFVDLELKCQCWTWFTRVPSKSNPSDDASRLDLTPSAANLFATVVQPPEIPAEVYL